jgi:hypothetical protein
MRLLVSTTVNSERGCEYCGHGSHQPATLQCARLLQIGDAVKARRKVDRRLNRNDRRSLVRQVLPRPPL